MDKDRIFNILALSGGGYRGLYTASLLHQLEKQYGAPLARHFDLITGTSIGGIIALALAKEVPTSDILNAFTDHASEIFSPSWFSFGGSIRSKYSNVGLKSVFSKQSLLGDKLVGNLKHRVIIPALNVSTGTIKVFRSPPTQPCEYDRKIPLIDVALATSAAPGYFPAHTYGGVTYIDGGLTSNAPGLIGYHEVKKFISEHENYRYDDSEIHLLSISTLSERYTVNKPNAGKGIFNGKVYWAKKVPFLTISALEKHSDHLLGHLLGEENYLHLDEPLSSNEKSSIDLDLYDEKARTVLLSNASASFQKAMDCKLITDIFSGQGD